MQKNRLPVQHKRSASTDPEVLPSRAETPSQDSSRVKPSADQKTAYPSQAPQLSQPQAGSCPDSCPSNYHRNDNALSACILESITDGAFTVNHHFEITSFNRAAEIITGFRREEVIGRKCYTLFGATISPPNCALKRSLETGRQYLDQKTIIKNIDGDDLQLAVSTAVLRSDDDTVIGGVETFRSIGKRCTPAAKVPQKYCFQNIISKNKRIQKIFSTLPTIAASTSTVLIEGESGSGKELFARAIHTLSSRKGPFVAINCAALPETLLESELFGYKKGAFTGAAGDKPGRFALAEHGTLFLDEIGDISPALQAKLLRVLQEKEYEPLGGTTTVKADVRTIAATNKNLKQLVKQNVFRSDLYFRLNVIHIALPPFCKRREDLPLLVQHFIDKFRLSQNKDISGASPEVIRILMRYDFPGNIRELENIIEHCFVMCQDTTINVECLPEDLLAAVKQTEDLEPTEADPLSNAEANAIWAALYKFNGHRGKTAEHLNIDKTTLWRKMKKYEIHYRPNKKGKSARPELIENTG